MSPPAASPRREGPADRAGAVAADVLRSRNYRWLAPDLVARVAAAALAGSAGHADGVKRTKRRLHQVCGAYAGTFDPDAAIAALQQGVERDGPRGLHQAARSIMSRHASTRERLPVLEELYPAVFALTGAPAVLLDVACGLGPLSWPWMGLPAGTRYLAYDADLRLVRVVDAFLTLCDVPHEAAVRDVVARPPSEAAGVALLLKSAPCLEQQAPGSTRHLLDTLAARHVVLSYPTRSLGGAPRGMVAHYRQQLTATLAGTPWEVAELPFASETVYVLARPSLAAGTGG